jgi:hypothetical protein
VGAFQYTVNWPTPATTLVMTGAPGIVAGNTALDEVVGPAPTPVMAETMKT